MIQRFQIEDLIEQDASGVVFRALDTETGKPVALRRFFPFGADGGGLHDDEQTAYNIALQRLSGLHHPALRSVVSGGCDPIDGIPYIGTEWIEGDSILPLLADGPFSAETATEVLTQALEVCELLSHVLAEEAVWIETDLRTIIVGGEGSGRHFTFWISPLKWLGGAQGQSSDLEGIVTLTEELMGWRGRVVGEQAGRGLGSWVKWLRANAGKTSLHEARENLAAAVGVEPPPPARVLVSKAAQPMLKGARRGASKSPGIIILVIAVIVAATLFWWRTGQSAAASSGEKQSAAEVAADSAAEVAADSAGEVAADSAAARASRRAAELQASAALADEQAAAVLGEQQADAAKAGGAIPWDSRELLLARDRQDVVIEGIVHTIHPSSSRKTFYLRFSENPGTNDARAGIEIGGAQEDAFVKTLESFVGKKVRVTGRVIIRRIPVGTERPEVISKEITAIQLAD